MPPPSTRHPRPTSLRCAPRRLAALEAAFKAVFVEADPDYLPAPGYPVDKPGEADLRIASYQVADRFDAPAFTIEQVRGWHLRGGGGGGAAKGGEARRHPGRVQAPLGTGPYCGMPAVAAQRSRQRRLLQLQPAPCAGSTPA